MQTLLSFSLQHLLSFIFSSSFFPPPTAFDYHHHHHHRHFPAPNLATPLSRLILILSPVPETFASVQFLWSSPLPLLQLCTASLTVHQCVLVVNSCGFNSFHHLCHYHISFTTTTNKYVSSPFPQPIVLFYISSLRCLPRSISCSTEHDQQCLAISRFPLLSLLSQSAIIKIAD